MATHSHVHAWRIPGIGEPGGLPSMGSHRFGHDWSDLAVATAFIGRTDAEAETPILWPPDAKSWLIGKDPDAGKDWRWEKGTTEDEMVGWHHRLNGHEVWVDSGSWWWTGRPGMCRYWDHKESDMTGGLELTEAACTLWLMSFSSHHSNFLLLLLRRLLLPLPLFCFFLRRTFVIIGRTNLDNLQVKLSKKIWKRILELIKIII